MRVFKTHYCWDFLFPRQLILRTSQAAFNKIPFFFFFYKKPVCIKSAIFTLFTVRFSIQRTSYCTNGDPCKHIPPLSRILEETFEVYHHQQESFCFNTHSPLASHWPPGWRLPLWTIGGRLQLLHGSLLPPPGEKKSTVRSNARLDTEHHNLHVRKTCVFSNMLPQRLTYFVCV